LGEEMMKLLGFHNLENVDGLLTGNFPGEFCEPMPGDLYRCTCNAVFEIEVADLPNIERLEMGMDILRGDDRSGEDELRGPICCNPSDRNAVAYLMHCPNCGQKIELNVLTRSMIILRIFLLVRHRDDCRGIGMTFHDSEEIIRQIVVAKNEKEAREFAARNPDDDMWLKRASCQQISLACDGVKPGVIGVDYAF
jgi:hypothetical protein